MDAHAPTPLVTGEDARLLAILDARLAEAVRDPVVTGEVQLPAWRRWLVRHPNAEAAVITHRAARGAYREMSDALTAGAPEHANRIRRIMRAPDAGSFFMPRDYWKVPVLLLVLALLFVAGILTCFFVEWRFFVLFMPGLTLVAALGNVPSVHFQLRVYRMPLDELLQFLTAHYRHDACERLQRCRAIMQPPKADGVGEAVT